MYSWRVRLTAHWHVRILFLKIRILQKLRLLDV